MPTKLKDGKDIVRELESVIVHDGGPRCLTVMIRSDGVMFLRAKGLKRQVMWKLEALYDKGVKEGRSC